MLNGVNESAPAVANSRDGEIDPDYVLSMFRFHQNVYLHDQEKCEEEACDLCSWDNHDTWELVVHFGGCLDEWMSSGGRPPRAWVRPSLLRRVGRWWRNSVVRGR